MEKEKSWNEIEDVLYFILKKIKSFGADDVIIDSTKNRNQHIKFVNNKIVAIKNLSRLESSIFFTINKKIIAGTFSELTKESMLKIVGALIKFSKNIKANNNYQGIADGPFKYRDDVYDKKIANINEEAITLVESAINTALKLKAKRCAGTFDSGYYETLLITSNNVKAYDKSTNARFSIRVFTDKDMSAHKTIVSKNLKGLNTTKVTQEATELLRNATKPKRVAAAKYDVIFDPMAFSNLLDSVGDAASIFNVEAGTSCLKNHLNKSLGNFTLIDDGTLTDGYHAVKFDGEGMPTKKNFIVQNGILKTFLHNTSSAKRHNIEPTANAGLIVPKAWNLVLEQGDYSNDELFKELKNGLYVTNIWYTRFQDYSTGDFSTIPRDVVFLIKNGQLAGCVKDIRISENILNILKSISALGNKQEHVLSWDSETPALLPRVLVKNVNVSVPNA